MKKKKKSSKKQDVFQFQEIVLIPRDQFDEFKRQMESANTEEVQVKVEPLSPSLTRFH